MKRLLTVVLLLLTLGLTAQQTQIALLKYRGGGDWYANPTSLPNLVKFCNQELHTDLNPDIATVEAGSPDIFNYPFVHMTGHGNVTFDKSECENLRNYLLAGGFLHIDDNYGLKDFIMPQMQKVFPELEWVELPYSRRCFLSWNGWSYHIRMKSSKSRIHSRTDCQKFTSTTSRLRRRSR